MRNLEYPARLGRGLCLRGRTRFHEARRRRRLARCLPHPQSRGVLRRLRPVARAVHDVPEGGQLQRVLPLLRRGPDARSTSCPTIRAVRITSAISRTRPRTIRSCSSASKRTRSQLCRALGYDLNTVEFAVENGIPYAIDFMNPAPDADLALCRPGQLRLDRARSRGSRHRKGARPPRNSPNSAGQLS